MATPFVSYDSATGILNDGNGDPYYADIVRIPGYTFLCLDNIRLQAGNNQLNLSRQSTKTGFRWEAYKKMMVGALGHTINKSDQGFTKFTYADTGFRFASNANCPMDERMYGFGVDNGVGRRTDGIPEEPEEALPLVANALLEQQQWQRIRNACTKTRQYHEMQSLHKLPTGADEEFSFMVKFHHIHEWFEVQTIPPNTEIYLEMDILQTNMWTFNVPQPLPTQHQHELRLSSNHKCEFVREKCKWVVDQVQMDPTVAVKLLQQQRAPGVITTYNDWSVQRRGEPTPIGNHFERTVYQSANCAERLILAFAHLSDENSDFAKYGMPNYWPFQFIRGGMNKIVVKSFYGQGNFQTLENLTPLPKYKGVLFWDATSREQAGTYGVVAGDGDIPVDPRSNPGLSNQNNFAWNATTYWTSTDRRSAAWGHTNDMIPTVDLDQMIYMNLTPANTSIIFTDTLNLSGTLDVVAEFNVDENNVGLLGPWEFQADYAHWQVTAQTANQQIQTVNTASTMTVPIPPPQTAGQIAGGSWRGRDEPDWY